MKSLPHLLVMGALWALPGSSAWAADDVLEPKENVDKRTIPGDPRPHYYAMSPAGKLTFDVQGKGMVVFSFVNHRKGSKRAPSKLKVLLDGESLKDIKIACTKGKAKFAETKSVKPCGRVSKEVEIPAGSHTIELKVTRSRFGLSVSPVLISEAERTGEPVAAAESAEEDPLGLELVPIAETSEAKPTGTSTSSADATSTAGSSSVEPGGSSSVGSETEPSTGSEVPEEEDPLSGEGMDLAPIPEIGPDPYAQPERAPEPRSRWANPWVWTLVGVGAAAGATGAIFGTQSKDAFDEAKRVTTPQVSVGALNDDGRKKGILANAMFAASGAAVVSAVLVLALSGGSEPEATTEVRTSRRWGLGIDRQGAAWGLGAWFDLD